MSAVLLTPRVQDDWLNKLASEEQLWSEDTIKDAKHIAKRIKEIKKDGKHRIGVIAGLFAAGGSALGVVPLFGGALGSPLAFLGNYYGTVAGANIGFDYADQCDLRQDLFANSETHYTSLAIRLLDRYLKTMRLEQAKKIETESKVKIFSSAEKQKLRDKRTEVRVLAQKIELQLPRLERNAIEIFRGPVKDKMSKKKQRQYEKIQKEVLKVTNPLKEVCQYISGQLENFSSVILKNELITMSTLSESGLKDSVHQILNAKREAENEALLEMVKALKKRVRKLEKNGAKS